MPTKSPYDVRLQSNKVQLRNYPLITSFLYLCHHEQNCLFTPCTIVFVMLFRYKKVNFLLNFHKLPVLLCGYLSFFPIISCRMCY